MSHGNGPKLQKTKHYDLFSLCKENRPLDLTSHKAKLLRRSMQAHGFLPAYPMHCNQQNGRLVIRDGQNRFSIARELGLEVYYVLTEQTPEIDQIANTQDPWNIRDYVGTFAARGNKHYIELREFSEMHGIPIQTAMSILSDHAVAKTGTAMARFREGKFQIRNRSGADRVAHLYTEIGAVCPAVKTTFFIQALFAMCLVEGLEDDRLISGAKRCRELLHKFGGRDGYLSMLEDVYNFGRHTRVAIKIAAENALRQRNPRTRGTVAAIA